MEGSQGLPVPEPEPPPPWELTTTYDWLRPRARTPGTAGVYVTNSLLEVGERVILKGVVQRNRSVHHADEHRLTSLERVFLVLDGKGGHTKSYYSDLQNAINAQPRGETEYFRYRACANGTLHLAFKRADLLAEFNKRAAGAVLRPVETP